MAYTFPQVAKTAGAALATAGVVAGALLANSTFLAIVPPFVVVILTSLVAAGIVAGVVFGIPNEATPAQQADIIKSAGEKIVLNGAAVISGAVIEKASNSVQDAIDKVTPDVIGKPVEDVVGAVSGAARSAIEDLLSQYKLGH